MKVNRTNKLSLPATANGIMAIWLSLVSLGPTTWAGGANSSPVIGDRLLVAASAKGIGSTGVKQVKANTARGMNPLLVNPFSDSATVAGYEAWYEATGRRADRLETALLEYLLADFPQAWSVLEVGCGTGHFARWFWEQGLRAVGLDLSSAMLTEAVRLASPPRVQGDALTLPFATGAFDLSVLITTLEFVADPALALVEAMRVARYGLILGVLNRQSLMGWRLKCSWAAWYRLSGHQRGFRS